MSRCTGACCREIIVHNQESANLGLVCMPRVWMRIYIDRDRSVEMAKIWSVLRFERVRDDGREVHRCAALGQAGCQLARDDRPSMCTNFPYAGDRPCHECGARSDAEARGVAIERTT